MRKSLQKILVLFLLVLASGCVTTPNSSTYSRQQMGRAASVSGGIIISLRIVDISGTNSGIGAATGAAAGGVGGSYAGGGGRGTALAVIGGVVAGGIAGAIAEGELTKAKATEFLIKEDNGDMIAVVQENDQNLKTNERVLIMRMDKVRIVRDPTT